jgi:hypothetical protein
VHLDASTKSHVHQKFENFWTNIAFTMACPNSKNGQKNGLCPLGAKPKGRPSTTLKIVFSVMDTKCQLQY